MNVSHNFYISNEILKYLMNKNTGVYNTGIVSNFFRINFWNESLFSVFVKYFISICSEKFVKNISDE